jgi:integrase
MNQDVEKPFLEYYRKSKSPNTAKSYAIGLNKFCKWIGKTPTEILIEHKSNLASSDVLRGRYYHDKVEEFVKVLQQQGLGVNTARTNSIGVCQFFRYYSVPIGASFKTVVTKKTIIPDISEFRRMYNIADLRGKLIYSLGLDLAWRIDDFINLKKSDIPDLNQECPIQIEKLTAKEKELSSTFISCESVALLKEWMPSLPEDNEYLFPNRNHGHIDTDVVYDYLHDLSKRIGMKIPQGKHFSFHSFRKRFLSTATTLGIDRDVKDLLVGKSVGQSHETYYGDAKLKDAFVKIRMVALSLTQTEQAVANHDMIESLQSKLSTAEKELSLYKNILRELVKDKIDTAEAIRGKLSADSTRPLRVINARWKELYQQLEKT